MVDKPNANKRQAEAEQGESSQLGLDELMIVNPGPGAAPHVFVGDDGALYSVSGVSSSEQLGRLGLFLGEDGGVYSAEPVAAAPTSPPARATSRLAGTASEPALGGYLLAADGTLYRVSKSALE